MNNLDQKTVTAMRRIGQALELDTASETDDLRDAARIAALNPDEPASRLVMDLICTFGSEPDIPLSEEHRDLTRAIVRIWQLDRSGQDAIRALEDAGALVAVIPEQPASEAVRGLCSMIRRFPHDPEGIAGMRGLMRDAIEISIPGISRLIDQGWSLHDRDLRLYGLEDLMVEIYPGVWARRSADQGRGHRSGIYKLKRESPALQCVG